MLMLLLTLTVGVSPEAEAFPHLQDPQSSDVRLATRFIEDHLLTLEIDPLKGLGVRQRGRHFEWGESLVDAVSLVPAAAALAKQGDDEYRAFLTLGIIGVTAATVGLALLLPALIFSAIAVGLPMLIAAVVLDIGALVVTFVAQGYSQSYLQHLHQLVTLYNQALFRGVTGEPAPTTENTPQVPPGMLQLARF